MNTTVTTLPNLAAFFVDEGETLEQARTAELVASLGQFTGCCARTVCGCTPCHRCLALPPECVCDQWRGADPMRVTAKGGLPSHAMTATHFCVYVIRAHSGTCLYVGQSVRVPERMGEHRRRDWWGEVASIEVWHLDSYAAMCEAEARLIRDLCPIHNVIRPMG